MRAEILNMRTREEIISLLTNPGIIAVIRTDDTEAISPACEALVSGGVRALEITMTSRNALSAIRDVSRRFAREAVTGAGSVLNVEMCRAVIEAGADFVVSPVMKPELVPVAHAANRPIMLGTYTPTEAQLAHEAGADFVKIFPAEGLGPTYIKSILAPLPHLKIVPTGGVDPQTVVEFMKAGCVAVGAGSALVSAKILREKNWAELTRLAREFVAAVQKIR